MSTSPISTSSAPPSSPSNEISKKVPIDTSSISELKSSQAPNFSWLNQTLQSIKQFFQRLWIRLTTFFSTLFRKKQAENPQQETKKDPPPKEKEKPQVFLPPNLLPRIKEVHGGLNERINPPEKPPEPLLQSPPSNTDDPISTALAIYFLSTGNIRFFLSTGMSKLFFPTSKLLTPLVQKLRISQKWHLPMSQCLSMILIGYLCYSLEGTSNEIVNLFSQDVSLDEKTKEKFSRLVNEIHIKPSTFGFLILSTMQIALPFFSTYFFSQGKRISQILLKQIRS